MHAVTSLSSVTSHSQSFLFDSLACIAVSSLSPVVSHSQSFLFDSLACIATSSLLLWCLILNPFSLIHMHALQPPLFSCGVSFSIFALLQTRFLLNMPSLSFLLCFSLVFFYHSLFQSLLFLLCCFKSMF